jgi:hypothetical protein
MLTSFHLDDYEHEVLRARASGFLLKVATAPELVRAVQGRGRGCAADPPAPGSPSQASPPARSARLQAGRPKYCG